MFDGLSLDPLALFDDGLGPAEVGVRWRDVAQALNRIAEIVVGAAGRSGPQEVESARATLPLCRWRFRLGPFDTRA